MMKKKVISVDSISKRYRVGLAETQYDSFGAQIGAWITFPIRNFKKLVSLSKFSKNETEQVHWALKDVSFEVFKGEVLGVIGHNGAGKSTLLKILSRITEPSSGEVKISGRVSSLLEVGTGFHPELTGRDNVYMNGTILGMTKKEIDGKFKEIVKFSGVEKYIDTPVKFYSSGMKVRLAFSVAAHLEPEILIIDEVLAVGDAEFQKKCLGKMEDVAGQGRTVLFVSHNMASLSALCNRAILLNEGKKIQDGPVDDVIHHYLNSGKRRSDLIVKNPEEREGSGEVRIEKFDFYSKDQKTNNIGSEVKSADDLWFELTLRGQEDQFESIDIGIKFLNELDSPLFNCHTTFNRQTFKFVSNGSILKCRIPKLPLSPGKYKIEIWLLKGNVLSDKINSGLYLNVNSGDFYGTGKLPKQKNSIPFLVEYDWFN